jgi:acetyltransferase-like isoleucine patch superfamily enzyme
VKRLLARLIVWRWVRVAIAALAGARLHPRALVFGALHRVHFGRGAKVGSGAVLDPGKRGVIVIGDGAWLSSDVQCETETRVEIGAGTTIQRRCTVNGSTRLGTGCILAPDVFVSSGTHPFRAWPHLPIREQERRLALEPNAAVELDRPVWIQADCWLGAHVVVCPGVTIGKGSVVGANAVVTRSVPPYSVVGGIPARVIGKRLDWLPPSDLNFANEAAGPYLLEGYLMDVGTSRCVRVTAERPMTVALRGPSGSIWLEVQAVAATIVLIAGVQQTVAAGRHRLEFPCSPAAADGVLHVCVGIPAGAASVDVWRIGIAESERSS